MQNEELSGKVALITGAGSNVGRAVVARYRAAGMKLVLVDMRTAGLGEADNLVIEADLTQSAASEDLVSAAMKRFGRIDVLCCTVGIDPPTARTVPETSDMDWDRIMAVNVKSVFLSARAVLPKMIEAGSGCIVTVASQGALLTMPGMAAYGTSKAAVLGLTRAMAADHGKHGIRANCVCPSGLQMPSQDRLGILTPEQMARREEAMGKMVPLGRVCSPDDVADAIMFLTGKSSSFITGAAIPVEGGGTMTLRF